MVLLFANFPSIKYQMKFNQYRHLKKQIKIHPRITNGTTKAIRIKKKREYKKSYNLYIFVVQTLRKK